MQRNYFLRSQRLGFSEWDFNDLELALGLWGDYNVTKLFDSTGKFSESRVKARLNQEIETRTQYGYQYWPIFNLDNGEHIGCAGLRPYDLDNNILEIGFHIRSSQWRRGFATEAAKSVIDYAFNSLKISALFAGHNPKNRVSCKLLKSLGFIYVHDEFYKPTGLMHPSYILHSDDYLSVHGK